MELPTEAGQLRLIYDGGTIYSIQAVAVYADTGMDALLSAAMTHSVEIQQRGASGGRTTEFVTLYKNVPCSAIDPTAPDTQSRLQLGTPYKSATAVLADETQLFEVILQKVVQQ